MLKKRRLGFVGALCCLAIIAALLAFLPSPADEAFRWFSKLGFPDVKGCKYVRVATGEWLQVGDKGPENSFIEAFLLSQSNGTFTVLTRDLSVRTFAFTTNGAPQHERIGFEPIDLPTQAEAYLRLLTNPPKDRWRRYGQQLNERAEVFVLAWSCDLQGHSALARRLFEQASAMRDGNQPTNATLWERIVIQAKRLVGQAPKQPDMVEQLQRDLGHTMMWRSIVDFENPDLSRKELLSRFEAIVKNYPKCEHVPRATETIGMLRQMVQEDESHAQKPVKPRDQMSSDERVNELVFRLRDQNGRQWSQPGWCDIFQDPRKEQSAAHQLVKLGYDAVPQLIATLEDKHFSRSVGYHRNFYFSHQVLTVGDCALAVLQRIAGRGFYAPTTTSGYMSKDGKAPTTKEQAEAWWAEFRKKGEQRVLTEATERGDDNAPAQAELLLERYPDAALAAVMKGATNASREWTRDQLVDIAGRVPGDTSTAFLSVELKDGPYLRSCVTAGWALHRRGQTEAVHVLIKKWHQFDSTTSKDDSSDVESLIGFLANCDTPEAIAALGINLSNRPVALRLSVISALGERGRFISVTHGGLGLTPSERTNAPPAEVGSAAERVLVVALGDTEQRMGMSGTWDSKSFDDPRICDVAAHVLWKRWPDKYEFDLNGAFSQRERQRIACMNVWRKANGLTQFPLPEPRIVAPARRDLIQPLLRQLREGTTQTGISEALHKLQAMGISALSEAHRLLQDLPAQHLARADLAALEKRLSCIVIEFRLSEKSLQPAPTLVTLLASLTNAPLDTEKLIAVLVQFAKMPAGEAANLELKAIRDEDMTGVVVELKLTGERAKQAGSQKGWRTFQRVKLAKESVHSSSGGSSPEYGATREAYNDLATAITTVLSSSPETPFLISVTMTREE